MSKQATASLLLMLGGALWGLLWIPLRVMEDHGVEGAWPALLGYLFPALVTLPVTLIGWRHVVQSWPSLLGVLVFCGTAFAFYGIAIVMTEVNRAILLFYLTPLWGTLIGLAFLGERLTLRRALALLIGFAGLLVVLDIGLKLPWPRNIGDWMAVLSGLSWAVGSTVIYRAEKLRIPDQLTAFFVGAVIVCLLSLVLFPTQLGAVPRSGSLQASIPMIIILTIGMPIVLVLTIYPAGMLPPGRVGILLMTEVLFGLASAILVLGEVLSLREGLGAMMILSAAVLEVSAPSKPPTASAAESQEQSR